MSDPKKKYYSEGVLVCDTTQELLNEVKSLETHSAEVDLYDEEFKKLVKLLEGVKK